MLTKLGGEFVDNYYFKLVCVDEQNPIGYSVLEDVNLKNLEDVHKYVETHINNHTLGTIKWMLIPMIKPNVTVV